MGEQTMQLEGRGVLFDRTNDTQFDNFVSVSIGSDIESITLPQGDLVTDQIIPIKQTFSGRFEFRDLSADTLTVLFAGSAAANTVAMEERQQETVPASPYTITLDHSLLYVDTIQITDSTGFKYDIVTAAPSAGQAQVTASSTSVVFHSSDEGKVVECTYLWTQTGGETVSITPTGLPTTFEFVGFVRAYDRYAGARLTDGFGIHLVRCKRKGRCEFGVNVGDMAPTIGFDFDAEVLSTGDIKFYYPST